MGFFDFFVSYTKAEAVLLDFYARSHVLQGMPPDTAKKLAKELLDNAIRDSKTEGAYDFPENLGDMVLGKVKCNNRKTQKIADYFKEKLTKLRDEGVKDEDFCWWWNLNAVERQILINLDQKQKNTATEHEVKSGITPNMALEMVRKSIPIYGDPSDTTQAQGDDRPLPYELKDKIERFIESRSFQNPDIFRRDVEKTSSFNAFIRKEIQKGNL